MRFIWDENKNAVNIARREFDFHEFDFKDAYRIFQSSMRLVIDEREDYGETRYIGTGLLDNRVVVVVYTEPDEDTIRIISLRKAAPSERKQYQRGKTHERSI